MSTITNERVFLLDMQTLLQYKTYRELDINTHISLKYGYVYFQVSKAASSTVKYYLQLIEVKNTGRVVLDVNNRNLSPHIWPSQLKQSHFLSLMNKDSFKKVAFVRNPYERVLSCYLHRIKKACDSPSSKSFYRFTKGRYGFDVSFPDFVRVISSQSTKEQDSHWRVQSDEIYYDKFKKFDFIGKFERLNEDLPRLIRLLARDEIEVTENMSPEVTNADSKLHDYYTAELRSLIYQRYRVDFENFGYPEELI
jgi:hypothetical protein